MPYFAYLKRCSMHAVVIAILHPIVWAFECERHNIKAVNRLHKKIKYSMTKINKAFDKYFDLCETILF